MELFFSILSAGACLLVLAVITTIYLHKYISKNLPSKEVDNVPKVNIQTTFVEGPLNSPLQLLFEDDIFRTHLVMRTVDSLELLRWYRIDYERLVILDVDRENFLKVSEITVDYLVFIQKIDEKGAAVIDNLYFHKIGRDLITGKFTKDDARLADSISEEPAWNPTVSLIAIVTPANFGNV